MTSTSTDALVRYLLSGVVPPSLHPTEHTIYVTDLQIDSDGYPSEIALHTITRIRQRYAALWMREEFAQLARSLPYSSVIERTIRERKMVTIATGGWSGTEDFIAAVLRNAFLSSHLVEKSNGGRFVFDVT